MTRRLKLRNPTRYTVPRVRCVVVGCTTEPQPDHLICFWHARALSKAADQAQADDSEGGDGDA